MSLLSLVAQAVESRKADQAQMDDRVQLYRELLHTLTSQPNTGSDEAQCANDAATDTDASPGEKEDMELLERALEKALRVRTGTGYSKKASSRQSPRQKEPGTTAVAHKGMQATAASKGNRSTSNEHKRPDGVVHHQAARKGSGSVDLGQLHTSTLHSKKKIIRSNSSSGRDPGRAAATSALSNNAVPVSQTEEPGAHGLPPRNGKASEQTAKWRSLRSQQNRLWDKVAGLQREPVPGRSHFMERMRATFPRGWPRGSPDQTRFLVDRLTQQGHDLNQHCQTTELLAKQTQESTTELGGEANDDESCLRFPMTAARLQNVADQAKQEWEAWDRWRPEGGCLCPTRANGVGGTGMIAPLPPTVTYTTEAELRELETLRMRVSLLQQEIYLEQAILDSLSPRLSSMVPGPGCPDLSVLRDMYSLLGEGGERSPAIVLDSEPD
ncbi:tubulin epsilon and delta complex protein 2 isoform X2 [Cyclopterus lumpus]|uniref:tubulin epsilon and delta complex protein 2 isoform X2 n=1 Tax=Cyclopterus lumpus TaxID=8103 RepID=UPI0014873424|nr:tubulin epsilon and delta complex protein 2 isoform X2 [Cyclopterus lumpus]